VNPANDWEKLVSELQTQQTPNGAFRCTISYPDHTEPDSNGFATALVLRRLQSVHDVAGLDVMRRRALDYLERCADPCIPGAFGFWSVDNRPAWAKNIPADADDTAIVNLTLYQHGRRTLQQVQDVIFNVLMPRLTQKINCNNPRWLRSLTFPTWLSPDVNDKRANVIDCCVNTNVLALLAVSGLTDLPGYVEAANMIEAALKWVEVERRDNPKLAFRLWTITPYYPDPQMFLDALRHAIHCGADILTPAYARLKNICEHIEIPAEVRGGLFSNAYQFPIWRCRAFRLFSEVNMAHSVPKTLIVPSKR
jgi:hypothetical protein